MGVTIRITFPFGRYYATPWGQHVNEGNVEWPPSPWRLVRALTASWHQYHPAVPAEAVRDALSLLCAPPRYRLPPSGRAVTRHYMPKDAHLSRHGKSKTSLVLNSFVTTKPMDTASIHWDTAATDVQIALLDRLASTLAYVGRAESRTVLKVEGGEPLLEHPVRPVESGSLSTEDTIRLLVPDAPLELDSVHVTTDGLQRTGRTQPPATTWYTYPVPNDLPDFVGRRPPVQNPTMMRFAIVGRGRPSITDTALLADTARRALTGHGKDEWTLHGHDGSGQKREDDHRHAHYLILPFDGSGRADSLVVYAPEGIPRHSAAALAEVTQIWIPQHLQKRLGQEVRIALESIGPVGELGDHFVRPARVWRSLTPFTTRRHRKKKESREEFLEDAVRRHLRYRNLPHTQPEVAVKIVDGTPNVGASHPAVAWYRSRRLGREHQHEGCHVRLTFDQPEVPVGSNGPELLLLGSLAHFGLGLFVNDDWG